METNIYRINDYSILRITNKSETKSFHFVGNTQYVLNDEKVWNNTVWTENFNSINTRYRLNKTYSNSGLLSKPNTGEIDLATQTVELIVRQNYSFVGVFGLLITVFEPNTNKVYLSQIVNINDFKIIDKNSRLLIDGSFWLEHVEVYMPVESNLMVQVTEIKYSDITSDGNNIGLIHNYPHDFVPLISEKVIPDYIQTDLSINYQTGILTIRPFTTNNTSLEQSILDYFDQEVADIKISHLITYGINTAGNEQYKQLRVSNEVNKYLPITLSLDLIDFGKNANIDIVVTTEILVNGKLAQRTASLNVSNTQFINQAYFEAIKHPDTIYPVTVNIEHNISQKVIQKDKEISEVVVYRPVFTEIVKDSFTIDNKNITFGQIAETCYLVIHATDSIPQQIIESKRTFDGVLYFDIKDVIPVDVDTTYSLRSVETDMIIGEGTVFASKKK
jgi:hypothetical protein|nr:MAG TPA: hypothetical protein [Caudoviricetes sp.]